MESRGRASGEQIATLLEFMESHGDLAKPQPGPQGRIKADRLWQELSNLLNSIGGGVTKSTEKWKKVWADWKSKTKKKALIISRHSRGTGGGPNTRLTLSSLETRVLGFIGALAVEGIPEIEEQGFNRPSTTPLPTNDSSHFDIDISVEGEILPDLSQFPPDCDFAIPSTSAELPSTMPPLSQRRHGERRRLTPLDRAARQFAAIEERRLMMEEKRAESEARFIDVLSRIVNLAENIYQHYLQNRVS